MSNVNDIKDLLVEIRDNQRLALEKQSEQLELSRQQVDRARSQVEESIQLQKVAMKRFKTISLVAIPGIILCIVLILYLVVKYF